MFSVVILCNSVLIIPIICGSFVVSLLRSGSSDPFNRTFHGFLFLTGLAYVPAVFLVVCFYLGYFICFLFLFLFFFFFFFSVCFFVFVSLVLSVFYFV